MVFENRQTAGNILAQNLEGLVIDKSNAIVIAIPNGGVPIGLEISKQLNIPFDILVVTKISMPDNEDYGIGAISEKGALVLEQSVLNALDGKEAELEKQIEAKKEELLKKTVEYGYGDKLMNIQNKTVILVDDGSASGITFYAAIKDLQKFSPSHIIIATPTCSEQSKELLEREVYKIVYINDPKDFESVSISYKNFEQLTDQEVINLLQTF